LQYVDNVREPRPDLGWGLFYENTEGALIKTEPKKPTVPIKRGVETNETQV
jgi:hypothetical protein